MALIIEILIENLWKKIDNKYKKQKTKKKNDVRGANPDAKCLLEVCLATF